MAGYTNMGNDGQTFWASPDVPGTQNFYDSEYSNLQNQQLDFQSFGDGQVDNQQYYTQNITLSSSKTFLDPNQPQYPEMFTPLNNEYQHPGGQENEFEEPPLLEELEIYPDRILEKTLAVLFPFRSHSLADDAEFLTKDTDLAGPIAYCLALAVCLFVSGNKAPFGYIYGLSVMSCVMMYCLLTLMTTTSGIFTMSSVASVLGYCLLPVVGLSVLGVFFSLHNTIGILLGLCAVLWSSISASRLFVTMSGDSEQRPLIAYPCALVCGVFALLIIF